MAIRYTLIWLVHHAAWITDCFVERLNFAAAGVADLELRGWEGAETAIAVEAEGSHSPSPGARANQRIRTPFWESLKSHSLDKLGEPPAAYPSVILGDQNGGLTSSIPSAFHAAQQ